MKGKIMAAIAVVAVCVPAGYIIGSLLRSEPTSCNSLLMERANEADQKMVMSNSDGGLFLLTKGVEQGQVLFIGYVGPVTADSLRVQMINSGLSKVRVESDGTCVSEGGLEYTVVTGSYLLAPTEDPT